MRFQELFRNRISRSVVETGFKTVFSNACFRSVNHCHGITRINDERFFRLRGGHIGYIRKGPGDHSCWTKPNGSNSLLGIDSARAGFWACFSICGLYLPHSGFSDLCGIPYGIKVENRVLETVGLESSSGLILGTKKWGEVESDQYSLRLRRKCTARRVDRGRFQERWSGHTGTPPFLSRGR